MTVVPSEVLGAVERGWSVIPVGHDKRPRIPKWKPYQETAACRDQVERWAHELSPAAWAVITGKVSGLVALDFDGEQGQELRELFGLPEHVRTGSGGSHTYFEHPGDRTIQTLNGKAKHALGARFPGLDIKGDGGYAIFAGQNGAGPYRLVNSDPLPLRLLPPELRRELGLGAASPDALLEWALGRAAPGSRNQTSFDLACQLRDNGHDEATAEHTLRHYAARVTQASEPYTEDEALASVHSAYGRLARDPWGAGRAERSENAGAADAVTPGQRAPLTDLGNAERYAEDHRGRLMFVPGLGWHGWDGKRWAPDQGRGIAIAAAKRTARLIRQEADRLEGDDAKQVFAHAIRTEKRERLAAMVKLAESDPQLLAIAEQLDADPYLLNVENGTLDLRTGTLRAHDPADRITKLAPVAYDPAARDERWDGFVCEVCGGDTELAAFLKRACGYTLTGDTGEEVLFFPHGPGATGKSTFLDALSATLGDYATSAEFETFLTQRTARGPRDGVAQLAGARLVTSVEVEDGRKLAVSLVKQLTGGDTVRGAFLYRDSFQFRPQFKLWLAANHRPQVSADDDAIWRRIKAVPFVHVVPAERRDPSLKRQLRTDRKARAAILAWAVQGCLAWQRDGLGEPPAVTQATETYRAAMEPLADFIEDLCVTGPQQWTPAAELWSAYELWSDGRPELSRRAFGDALARRGHTSDTRRLDAKKTRGWTGIGLHDA